MVFVKVRETYDLHTLTEKISLIGIHTPSAGIIKRNYPGLLMQCKAYRPVQADVRMACASVLPLDPNGVGVGADQVSPEDVFNPILYKAISNFGMSQIEQFVNAGGNFSILGAGLDAGNDGITSDDFATYYGLLAQTHEWKHANPQAGLEMRGLKPLVYETYQTIGDNAVGGSSNPMIAPKGDDSISTGQVGNIAVQTFRGRAHEMPMLNCTVPRSYNGNVATQTAGFVSGENNGQLDVPAPKVFCGLIVVPPSRKVSLYYRLVCEWTLEFSMIRPLGDITTWAGLQTIGNTTHYSDYSYDSSKLPESTGMVDTSDGSDIKKIM